MQIIWIMINHWAMIGLGLLVCLGLWFLVPDIRRYLVGPIIAAILVLLAYWKGKRTERAAQAARTKKIVEEREKAYAEIGNRNTDAADVADRLRDGSY